VSDVRLPPLPMKISKFCELTGYTDKAVRRKKEEGVWLVGHEVHVSPNGDLTIDPEGYTRWAKGLPRLPKPPAV
jgi:hypothetical protein